MTFPDPYHEHHWHECPHHLRSPHLDSHNLHQTSHMICQNDHCTFSSVNMTFPDPYHEQHWHECPKHLHSHNLDPHDLHQSSQIICRDDPWTEPSVKMRFPDPYHEQHWHECPKHLHSHHLDPHGLQQTTQMKNQLIGNWSGIFLMCQMCALVQVMWVQIQERLGSFWLVFHWFGIIMPVMFS